MAQYAVRTLADANKAIPLLESIFKGMMKDYAHVSCYAQVIANGYKDTQTEFILFEYRDSVKRAQRELERLSRYFSPCLEGGWLDFIRRDRVFRWFPGRACFFPITTTLPRA